MNSEEIRHLCNLEIANLPFSEDSKSYLNDHGIRFVGEFYLANFLLFGEDWRQKIASELTNDYDLPNEMNPLALGWQPSYWNDPVFLEDLNELILVRCPTPKAPNWLERTIQVSEGRKTTLYPPTRCLARRYHKRGIHFVGELFPPTRSFFVSDLGLKQFDIVLANLPVWSACILPPGWSSPADWQTGWKNELEAIEKEEKDLAEAQKTLRQLHSLLLASDPSS